MRYKIDRCLAALLALLLAFTALPAAALAESAAPTEEISLEQVQAMLDALPDADTITADTRADVQARLAAIDKAKQALTDEERAGLDTARYQAAAQALLALEDSAGGVRRKPSPFPMSFPAAAVRRMTPIRSRAPGSCGS